MLSPPPPTIRTAGGLTGGGTGYDLTVTGTPFANAFAAVNTYMFNKIASGSLVTVAAGATTAGSNFQSPQAGTWRSMHYLGVGESDPPSLWLRIS